MPHSPVNICVFGHHETDYPRNVLAQKWMRAAGFGVRLVRSVRPFPLRHFDLAIQYLRMASQVDVVWITEGGHRLVPFFKLVAFLTRKQVIFDPFISRYNTRVEDRRLYRPGSLGAWICKWQDWSACRAADHLVFDTQEHHQYFFSRYRLNKPFAILEIGADEDVFYPEPARENAKDYHEVLFYGTYIPLQGVNTILAAAEVLRGEASIRFTMVGGGQEYAAARASAEEKKLANVRFEDYAPAQRLHELIAEADICLGIFGDTVKAGQVVPNKGVQCAAMGKPLISRDSPAMRRYFKDGRDILLTPAADGSALAEAILKLSLDAQRRNALGAQTRLTYERNFSDAAHETKMRNLILKVVSGKRKP